MVGIRSSYSHCSVDFLYHKQCAGLLLSTRPSFNQISTALITLHQTCSLSRHIKDSDGKDQDLPIDGNKTKAIYPERCWKGDPSPSQDYDPRQDINAPIDAKNAVDSGFFLLPSIKSLHAVLTGHLVHPVIFAHCIRILMAATEIEADDPLDLFSTQTL